MFENMRIHRLRVRISAHGEARLPGRAHMLFRTMGTAKRYRRRRRPQPDTAFDESAGTSGRGISLRGCIAAIQHQRDTITYYIILFHAICPGKGRHARGERPIEKVYIPRSIAQQTRRSAFLLDARTID